MRKKVYLFLIHSAFIINLIFLVATTYGKKQQDRIQENEKQLTSTQTTYNVKDKLFKNDAEAGVDEIDSAVN